MLDYVSKPNENPIILTCEKPLQLNGKTDQEIRREVFLNIAQTIINFKSVLKERLPETLEINKWINSTFFQSIEAQAFGFGVGNALTANESIGFSESGLPDKITRLLENIFPDKTSGGIVYIIDNLELLESSKNALARIEALRDTLFNLQGVRWILCGAYGILPGLIQSPRLEGCLGSTLKINKISHTSSKEIFSKRLSHFKDGLKTEIYTPIDKEDFYSLYMLLGSNLRSTLKTASEYISYLSDESIYCMDESSKKDRFDSWLVEYAISRNKDIERHITSKPLEVLFNAIKLCEGEFCQSDHEKLGFKSAAALRPHLQKLEEHGLISSTRDEEDKRRLDISVTGRGWLMRWARLKKGIA